MTSIHRQCTDSEITRNPSRPKKETKTAELNNPN
ncbi:hypothetical protein VTP01DRAFT_7264 [Rhizomucor pusillus]